MVKQLIEDALASVVDRDPGATQMFKKFIERRLEKEERLDRPFLADILGDIAPRKRLLEQLVRELTSGSLQSTEQLSRAVAHFAIQTEEIYEDGRRLKQVFDARNQIAHEMDINFEQSNRSRRSRARGNMIAFTEEISKISAKFLSAVDRKLTNPQ